MELSKNTEQSDPVLAQAAAVVRYDAACSLCRTLAEFMGKRVDAKYLAFLPNEKPSPEKLEVEVFVDGSIKTLTGESAWSWLLQHHPLLDEIHWAAQKLGISSAASRSLMRGADVLRRLCFRCR